MTIKAIVISYSRNDQKIITDALLTDSNFQVVASSKSGKDAISLSKRLEPDLVILSTSIKDLKIEVCVNKILISKPVPIIIIDDGLIKIKNKLKIMEYGLVDWFTVARKNNTLSFSEVGLTTRAHILSKINTNKFKEQIKYVNSTRRDTNSLIESLSQKSLRIKKLITQQVNLKKPSKEEQKPQFMQKSTHVGYHGTGRLNRIIVIGTSTGGPRLLNEIVPQFPANLPPVLLIQHMPIGFTQSFADRLNRMSKMTVKQAEEGEDIVPGTVYIAPGGYHLALQKQARGKIVVRLDDGEMVNFVKPAVDVTLLSAGEIYGGGVISVILTGMGSDGKKGSQYIKNLGGIILALHEKDSDIYGMNKSVIETGIVDYVLRKKNLVSGMIGALENRYKE